MNIKNYEFLCDTLERHGLGHPQVYDALKTKMQLGQDEFDLKGLKLSFGPDKVLFDPKFGKGESKVEGEDMYYLNKVKAILIKEGGEALTAVFSLYKQRGFNVKEMFNLMSGRTVYKKPRNEEGRWTKLDFKSTDEDGNLRVRSYYDTTTNFSMAREIGKLPVVWANAQEKEDTIRDLQSGERVVVTVRQDGKTDKLTIGVAPQMGGLELINSNNEVVKRTNTYSMEMMADEDMTQGKNNTQTAGQNQQQAIPDTTKQLMNSINKSETNQAQQQGQKQGGQKQRRA